MKLIILLQPDMNAWPIIKKMFNQNDNLIVGSLFATPTNLLNQLKKCGYKGEHYPVDTEERYYKARSLLDQFYADAHTLFRYVTLPHDHRWYWLTRAACKPGGPFLFLGDLFVAILCYLFEKDMLELSIDIDSCVIFGVSQYFPHVNWYVPTRWIKCHSSYQVFQKGLDAPKTGIVKRIVLAPLQNIMTWKRQNNPRQRGSVCFLVGNYFKDKPIPRPDYIFDPIPRILEEYGIPVQTVASSILIRYPDPQADIDVLLTPLLSDVLWALTKFVRVYLRLWFVRGRTVLGANIPEWLINDDTFRILFRSRCLIFLRSLIIYKEFSRFIRQKQPSVVMFYHEHMPPMRALQMAVKDLPTGCPRPVTIGFQHGWMPLTRSSHRYVTDSNERDNPYPTADYYFVYNEDARSIYSELSGSLHNERIKVVGFHRADTPVPSLVQEYKEQLSPYKLRVLFIGGDNDGTCAIQGGLEQMVRREGIALVIRPHPDPSNPFPITVAQTLTQAVHPKSRLWIPQSSDLDSLISACDLMLILPTTTVFLNAIQARKPIIVCKFDDRLDWYGLSKCVVDNLAIQLACSEKELCAYIDEFIATLKTGNQSNSIPSKSGSWMPPWFGKEAAEKIIQTTLAVRRIGSSFQMS